MSDTTWEPAAGRAATDVRLHPENCPKPSSPEEGMTQYEASRHYED